MGLKSKTILFRMAVILFFLVLSLGLVEAFLRFQHHQSKESILKMAGYFKTLYTWDREIGQLHKPNSEIRMKWLETKDGEIVLKTNNLGFREDMDTSKQKSCFRAIVYGDSQTDGFVNNNRSYVNVAERILSQEKHQVELLNSGVSTHSLLQEYLLLERHWELNPDLVVIGFYCGNDYSGILRQKNGAYLRYSCGNCQVVEAGPNNLVNAVYEEFQNNLDRKNNGPLFLWNLLIREDPKGLSDLFGRFEYAAALSQSLGQAFFFKRNPCDFSLASAMHEYLIQQIAESCRDHNAQVMFIVLPTKYQLERNCDLVRFEALEGVIELDPKNKLEDRIQKDICRILDKNKIPYLDPLDEFIKYKTEHEGELYYNSDHHLNEEGNQLLGRLLSDQLKPDLEACK